ncbi:MazG-like family protein [Effusibacillus pohliae]|uniref:MazG-like family protein n=1 Tax=Effusibacillus pohliae TaxID=232270 RepID=UPI000380379F|nr:MazG-like family protein [Effusibacillus pohliae]
MRDTRKDLDIAKNIKLIEWLKSELLDNLSGLFRGFLHGSESLLKDCLANIVVLCYLMARRLGIRYSQFDSLIVQRIRQNLEMETDFDAWQADLVMLEQHYRHKK